MVLLELKIKTENWIFQMYVSDARTPLPSLYTKALSALVIYKLPWDIETLPYLEI